MPDPANRPVRLVLADDHTLFREALCGMLRQDPGLEIIADVGTGDEAVSAVHQHAPDVVLMDVSMPGMNGIEATRQILEKRPNARVLVLSMHAETRFVSAVLEAGAAGYLLKDCPLEELIRAVGTVMANEVYLAPAVAGAVVRDYRSRRSGGSTPLAILSARERQVLQFLAEGRSTKQIADRLHLSVKTIGTHRENIMGKLDIRSVAGLTKYAIRHGLTSDQRDATAGSADQI